MRPPCWLSAACAAILASMLVSCRPEGSGIAEAMSEPSPGGAQREVERSLHELLVAAERKDFAKLESLHLYGPKFSKWDGNRAIRLDAENTRSSEKAGIEALDAFRPSVEDLKVDVFGQTAVATFVMPYEAVAAGRTSKTRARATLVWVKVDSGWKVAHEHFSTIP